MLRKGSSIYQRIILQSFTELPLSRELQASITEMGYTTPSPIQVQSIPILLKEPTDFLGLAATGTGKTAAFGIPLLEQLDASKNQTQALILCPTRELALQVSGQISALGKHKGIKALPVYGGSGYGEQIAGMKRGAAVIVGTPGRLVDHIDRGTLKLNNIRTVILDEADEMISMGFKKDMDKILSRVSNANTWLFSATMSTEVRKVADKFLKDPKHVQVNRVEMLSATVEQVFYPVREANKPEIVCKLIDAAEDFYGLIFCQTKSMVQTLTHLLTERGYRADCLHGDRDQSARERTMRSFREHKVNILVCTDVASRGLDVKDVSHVMNYSLPRELDSYVHRIGRTARSGQNGIAMSLVSPSQRELVFRIERMTKSKMREGAIPTRKEIGQKKINKMFETFMAQPFERAQTLLTKEWSEALANMPVDEIAARFLTMSFKDLFIERPETDIRSGPAIRTEERAGEGGQGRRPSNNRQRPSWRKKTNSRSSYAQR